ncbi:MAG: D-aminoacyl-tRNA deacylase [Myxococcota bacterium]
MKSVVQRVTSASVDVEGERVGEIGVGVLILLGVERGDTERDAKILANKLAGLRIFRGDRPMDRALSDVGGSALVVSQFTLAGSVRKGRRPGFEAAEDPARADSLYQHFCTSLASNDVPVRTGRFGANMRVQLVNDGPVTLLVNCRDGAIV